MVLGGKMKACGALAKESNQLLPKTGLMRGFTLIEDDVRKSMSSCLAIKDPRPLEAWVEPHECRARLVAKF